MNNSFYIKKFKHILRSPLYKAIESAFHEWRMELLNNSDEVRELIPLLDLTIEVIIPLLMAEFHIDQRIKAIEISQTKNWQDLQFNSCRLTIEKFFNKLYDVVPPDIKERIIEQLDCTPIVKSDLLHSIEDKNYVIFEKLIRDNNINFDLEQKIVSLFPSLSDIIKKVLEECEILFEEEGKSKTPEEVVSEAHDILLDLLESGARQNNAPEEDVENMKSAFSEVFESIGEALKKGLTGIKEVMCGCSLIILLFSTLENLQTWYLEGKLLKTERIYLQAFFQEKVHKIPLFAGIISMTTTEKFLTDSFSISEHIDENKLNTLICESAKNILPQRTANRMIEHQPTNQLPNKETSICPFKLPSELTERDTPYDAKKIFEKAIKKGFFTWNGNTLEPHLKRVLLDYFCGKLFQGDKVGAGYIKNKDNNKGKQHDEVWLMGPVSKGLPCKDLNILFGKNDDIGKARRNRIDCVAPRGYKKIDNLFKEEE